MFVYIPARDFFRATAPATFVQRDKKIVLPTIMVDLWLFPTSNVLINTFLRSMVVIAIMILGFGTSWYAAYWGAVVHDAVSLVLVRSYV
jgi:hypothetical protein